MNDDPDEWVLGESGSSKNRLLIKLTRFEGRPLLDLRFWYKDANDALRPTRKGLAVGPGHYSAVAETISRYSAAIQAWLGGDAKIGDLVSEGREDGVIDEARSRHRLTVTAAERASSSAPIVGTETVDDPRSRSFFAVEHEGGSDRVLLNRSHQFVQRLEEASTLSEMHDLIGAIIASFSRARTSVEGEESDSGLLDLLEHDWAERLAALTRGR